MNRDQKSLVIDNIKAVSEDSHSIVVFDYTGSTVKQLTELRHLACENNVTVMVVRNRLAKLAFEQTKYSSLNEVLKGATMIAIAHESPSASAKLLKKFSKLNTNIKIKGISIGENLLQPDQIDMVAKMPTRDEALAILARTLTTPAQQIAAGINDAVAKLARALKARSEQVN